MCDKVRLIVYYPLINYEKCNEIDQYSGYIMLDSYVDVKISVNHNPDGSFVLTSTFKEEEINEKIAKIKAKTIITYFDSVKEILEACYKSSNTKNNIKTYKKVINEYSEFVRFQINTKMSILLPDLSKIIITTLDENSHEHQIEIIVDYEESKSIFRVVNPNLPLQFSKRLTACQWIHLSELYQTFTSILEQLQPFFNVLDEVDVVCSVIDPKNPTWRDCHRRIWLDASLSIVIEIDPVYPAACPQFKFLGPVAQINELETKLNTKWSDWNENMNFVMNLQQLFNYTTFPRKPEQLNSSEFNEIECRICFTDRYNDKLPEVVCKWANCGSYYHCECIYEWLITLNSKRVFNRIYGQCPNCEKSISCHLI